MTASQHGRREAPGSAREEAPRELIGDHRAPIADVPAVSERLAGSVLLARHDLGWSTAP
ncbi:MAG: hypothetical protein ACJ77D_14800 [Chloroflexota bacterium]